MVDEVGASETLVVRRHIPEESIPGSFRHLYLDFQTFSPELLQKLILSSGWSCFKVYRVSVFLTCYLQNISELTVYGSLLAGTFRTC